jgi:hypothetical protein
MGGKRHLVGKHITKIRGKWMYAAKTTGYLWEGQVGMVTMRHLIPIYPSSAKHAPLCDYELTPIEYVICHRNTLSEGEKDF